MTDLAAKIAYFTGTAAGAVIGGFFWVLGIAPWWAIVLGAAVPSLAVAAVGFLLVMLFMVSGPL